MSTNDTSDNQLQQFLASHSRLIRRASTKWTCATNRMGLTREDYYQHAIAALIEAWPDRPRTTGVWESSDGGELLARWAFRICSNAGVRLYRSEIAANRQRVALKTETNFGEISTSNEADAGEFTSEAESIQLLREHVDRLPRHLQIVVTRYYGLDGRPAAETIRQTATDLRLSVDETSRRYHAGIEHLQGVVLQ